MKDADSKRISIDTFRKINKDYKSTNEEVEEIINSLYVLSNLAYDMNNNNE